MKVLVDYPEADAEEEMLRLVTEGRTGSDFHLDALETVVSPEDVLRLQDVTARLKVDRQVHAYTVRIARATRDRPGIAQGAGPRATTVPSGFAIRELRWSKETPS